MHRIIVTIASFSCLFQTVFGSDLYKDQEGYSQPLNITALSKNLSSCDFVSTEILTDHNLQQLTRIYTSIKMKVLNMEEQLNIRRNENSIDPEKLMSLKLLKFFDQKKIKIDKNLKDQMKDVKLTFIALMDAIIHFGEELRIYHETEDLNRIEIKIQDALQKQDFDSAEILFADKENLLKSKFASMSAFSNYEYDEFKPAVAILQKCMRNILVYENLVESTDLHKDCGLIIVLKPDIKLGYVKNYLPFACYKDEAFYQKNPFELIIMPYKPYPQSGESAVLIHKDKIEEDTGFIVITENPNLEFAGLKSNLLFNMYLYLGIDSPYSFTIAPVQFLQEETLNKFYSSSDKRFNAIKDFFVDVDTSEKQPNRFVAWPMQNFDKDIFELMFLEDVKQQAESQDKEARQMLVYIEEESETSIDDLIKEKKTQILQAHLEAQAAIAREQEQISQAVSQNQIQGRVNNSKKKEAKSKTSHKQYAAKKDQGTSANQNISGKNETVDAKAKPIYFKETLDGKRTKYRKMLGVVNKIMKHAVNQNLLQSTKGSHQTLHTDEGAVTLVRKHGGKDTSLSRSLSKRFYEKLTSIINL